MYSPKGTRIEGQTFDWSVMSLPSLDHSPQLALNIEDVDNPAVSQAVVSRWSEKKAENGLCSTDPEETRRTAHRCNFGERYLTYVETFRSLWLPK